MIPSPRRTRASVVDDPFSPPVAGIVLADCVGRDAAATCGALVDVVVAAAALVAIVVAGAVVAAVSGADDEELSSDDAGVDDDDGTLCVTSLIRGAPVAVVCVQDAGSWAGKVNDALLPRAPGAPIIPGWPRSPVLWPPWPPMPPSPPVPPPLPDARTMAVGA